MEFDSFMAKVLETFPNATVGEDFDGQVVIYTNLTTTEGGTLVDMDD